MKIAIIMRAVPGSGKSSMSQAIKRETECRIFSTDDSHIVDGEYRFNPAKLGEYHTYNLDAFTRAAENGVSPIVCDNTNVADRDAKPYAEAARENGYLVVVVHFIPDSLEAHLSRNIHSVPEAAIQKMMDALNASSGVGEDVRFTVRPDAFKRCLEWLPNAIRGMSNAAG